MFVTDEFGNIIFLPRNMAFAEAEGGDGGGSGGDGDGADTAAGGEGGDTQAGGEDTTSGGEGGDKSKLAGGDTLEGGDKGADGKSWRDGITDPDLQKVADKYASPSDLAKAYREAEKRLGKSIALPGKDATEEEVAAFHKALGVPEKPEDYKVEIPEAVKENWGETDEALKDSFLAKLHAAGATPKVVENAMGWYFEATQKIAEERDAQTRKATEKADEDLRKEWGEDYKQNLNIAARAAKEFGGDEFAEFLNTAEVDGVKLGDHPAFAKAFAQIGRSMSEDRPLIGGDADAAQTVQERIDELHALQDSNPSEYKSEKVQKELRELYTKLYGTASADGRAA